MTSRLSSPALAFAALMLAAAALALGPWLVRLSDVGAVASGFWRLALAVPMLGALALALGQSLRPPPRHQLALIALGAFFFAADIAAWHEGILITKMGNATLFGNFGSFMFAVYGLWLARKWPAPRQVGALGLALAGTLALLSSSLELGIENVRGDLLSLLAGLLYGFYLIAVDKVRSTLDPLPLIFWASAFAALFILPMALATGDPLMPTDWTPLVALAFSSQFLGQGLLVFAIGRLPPLVIGLGLVTQVAISAAIGWAVYGEAFTPTDWVGAIAIAAALLLVRLRRRATSPT